MCTSTSCMVNFCRTHKGKKKETDSEIMNLKKKDHSILKINGVNTPILNWQLFSKLFINFFLFCKSDMDMIKYTQQNTSQSYGKCWVLFKGLLNVWLRGDYCERKLDARHS